MNELLIVAFVAVAASFFSLGYFVRTIQQDRGGA